MKTTVKLTKPEQNLIATLETTYGLVLSDETEKVTRENPMSGATIQVTPAIAAIYDFIMETYRSYNFGGKMNYRGINVSIAFYDRTRYLMLKLDKQAYYDLVD